jgi:hypothetical protein
VNQSILGIALAVQLVAIVAIWGLELGGDDQPDPFLTFNASSADVLRIEDRENRVTVTRENNGWVLDGGLPADADKIVGVVEKLAGAVGSWPVATSDSAMERFEVTQDTYQRRIILTSGDETLADIFLGTSPGYRKVHARHVSGGPAYAIAFSNYEAGTKISDWVDKSLLRPDGEIVSITRNSTEMGWSLSATEDGWVAGNVDLDQDEVSSLAARIEGLRVLELVDAEPTTAPKIRFKVVDDIGPYDIAFYHLEVDDDYVATSSRFEGVFEVATYIVEQLDVSLEDLRSGKEKAVEVKE